MVTAQFVAYIICDVTKNVTPTEVCLNSNCVECFGKDNSITRQPDEMNSGQPFAISQCFF